eukprot:scaffold229538_cov38-Prasinocladus_malaysianus.AAC.1
MDGGIRPGTLNVTGVHDDPAEYAKRVGKRLESNALRTLQSSAYICIKLNGEQANRKQCLATTIGGCKQLCVETIVSSNSWRQNHSRILASALALRLTQGDAQRYARDHWLGDGYSTAAQTKSTSGNVFHFFISQHVPQRQRLAGALILCRANVAAQLPEAADQKQHIKNDSTYASHLNTIEQSHEHYDENACGEDAAQASLSVQSEREDDGGWTCRRGSCRSCWPTRQPPAPAPDATRGPDPA